MSETNSDKLVANTTQLWRKIRSTLEEREPSPWLRMSLSRGQLRVLALLSAAAEMSPGGVALALGVPKANVTEIIERLVAQGLVKREPNPDDRRSHNLTLTATGRAEVEHLREWSTRRIEKVFERLPREKLESLAAGLEDMLEAARSMPGRTAEGNKPSGESN